MKHLMQLLIYTLLGIVMIGCGSNDTESLEHLGETVVSSLQSQDIETYLSLCGTTDIEINFFKNASYPDSLKEIFEERIAGIEKRREHHDKRYKEQRTEEFHIFAQERFWANAEIVRIEPDSVENQYGMKYCPKITVYFKGHKPLQIREIAKSQDGWKIMENHPLRWN